MINLSVAHILKGFSNVPMNVISSIYGEWIFEQTGCNFYGFTGGFFSFICISTMSLISIERYIVVKYPFYAYELTNFKLLGIYISNRI